MEPATINLDGHIDLIDRQEADQLADDDRARQSRLADVMIVLERERAALEQTLRARLAETVTPRIAALELELDAAAPKFHIAIHPTEEGGDGVAGLTPEQCSAFEGEIADAVRALIVERAARSPSPRWQPVVTATLRGALPTGTSSSISREGAAADNTTPSSAPTQSAVSANRAATAAAPRPRARSIWLHLLFWLLALMVVGTAVLIWLRAGG